MTVPEAADIVGISPLNLRGWINYGNCPFGYCIRKREKRTGRNTYVIVEAQLKTFMEGIKNDGSIKD